MHLLRPKWKSSKRQTLLRWLQSREQRTVELQSIPSYWNLLHKAQTLIFNLRRAAFKVRWSLKDRKEWTSSRFIILKVFLKPLLFALFTVFLLEMGEHLFLQNRSYLKPYLPVWAIRVWNSLKEVIKIDISSYRPFLSPLITVSGTFLGLYFTALNVLLSSTYKQVTADIRRLLIRDKVGNAYIQIVAFTGTYALILFGLTVLGYTPGLGSLLLLIVLGVSEIYCFINQWLRLFQLFDPSTLVVYLTKDLVQWIREATIKSLWWRDASFQQHFQKQAEEVLTTYRNLIITVRGEEHLRSQSLIKLSNSLLSLLWFYEAGKSGIPSQSKWFKTTYQHKDWISASHSETSIATQTGTTLLPKEVPDLMWVEKEIGKIIDFALKGFLEKQDLLNALSLFQNFQNITKDLARNYSIEEALLLFRIIKVNTQNHSQNFEVPNISAENDLDPLRFTLALVDFCALSFINILLGLSEGAERINAESLRNFIESTDWENNKSLYRGRFPRKILQQLELAKKHLDFERTIEGKTVTPIWYQAQLLTLSYFRFLEPTVKSLLAGLEEVFVEEASRLLKQKKYIIAVHLIERGFETCNKFAHHFQALEKHCEELDKTRKLTDVPWVTFPWEEYQKKIDAIHQQLIILFSSSLHPIIQLPRIADLPDYFGHAYTVLTDECFKAMATGNEELCRKIFPAVFIACIEAHDRQKNLDVVDATTKFGFCADPIIDLFDLSGYAIIFKELDGVDYWDGVRTTWDNYFANAQDRLQLIKSFIAFGTYQPFVIFPRSLTRTSWQQYLGRILRARGLMQDDLFPQRFRGEQDNSEQHPSRIIRILTRSTMFHEKARDLFVVTYFKTEIDNGEIEIPDRMKRFHKSLFKEESKQV